jgi:predicted anti-sigma-YlaC factor YlaD
MTHTHDLNCDMIRQNLSDYIDGDLDSVLCNIIDEHIKLCTNCQIVINTLKKTIILYKIEAQRTVLPEDVRHRLLAKFNLGDDASRK